MEDTIKRFLAYIGENPEREGLKETPSRVIRSWSELYSGYKQDVASIFKTFEDEQCDEMVCIRDVEFHSFCEHHLLPFYGVAHIGYLPDKSIIGLSKLARLLDIYAKRLQVQERLTTQVVTALMDYLKPKGAGCVIEAKHMCMVCRGAKKQNATMITSSLRGLFRDDARTRSEFFQLVHRNS